VQFDPHLDVHNFADCTPEPSHDNFLLHCSGTLPPLLNVEHPYSPGHGALALPRCQKTWNSLEMRLRGA
jgi:hypothetical protein